MFTTLLLCRVVNQSDGHVLCGFTGAVMFVKQCFAAVHADRDNTLLKVRAGNGNGETQEIQKRVEAAAGL